LLYPAALQGHRGNTRLNTSLLQPFSQSQPPEDAVVLEEGVLSRSQCWQKAQDLGLADLAWMLSLNTAHGFETSLLEVASNSELVGNAFWF
jgi:hypothetical protein